MAAESNNSGESLPLTAMQRIDEVCLRFESAWQAGKSPRPEDFLDGWTGAELQAMLRELLRVDLEFRRARGIVPTVEEYLPRFPGYEALVREEVEARAEKSPPP